MSNSRRSIFFYKFLRKIKLRDGRIAMLTSIIFLVVCTRRCTVANAVALSSWLKFFHDTSMIFILKKHQTTGITAKLDCALFDQVSSVRYDYQVQDDRSHSPK